MAQSSSTTRKCTQRDYHAKILHQEINTGELKSLSNGPKSQLLAIVVMMSCPFKYIKDFLARHPYYKNLLPTEHYSHKAAFMLTAKHRL
jgi:hypothetical protein